jgi:hypothetical protein
LQSIAVASLTLSTPSGKALQSLALTGHRCATWEHMGYAHGGRHRVLERSWASLALGAASPADVVLLPLKALFEPGGLSRLFTHDGWGDYERHLAGEHHQVGTEPTLHIASTPRPLRTQITLGSAESRL